MRPCRLAARASASSSSLVSLPPPMMGDRERSLVPCSSSRILHISNGCRSACQGGMAAWMIKVSKLACLQGLA